MSHDLPQPGAMSAPEALTALANGGTLIDVRKAPARAAAGTDIAGTRWQDPYAMTHGDVPAGTSPVIFFCVHGHEVSRYAAALYRLHGREAHFVAGGFEALKAAGAALVPLDDGAADD